MGQEFRTAILEEMKEEMMVRAKDVFYSKDGDTLIVLYDKLGGFDGEIVMEFTFMPQYDGKPGRDVLQIFTTAAVEIKETLYESVEMRLNELNQKCMFGNFSLSREAGHIYHRYAFLLKSDDMDYSMKEYHFVWYEIYHFIDFFLAYIVVIATDKDFMSLEKYMEGMGEGD